MVAAMIRRLWIDAIDGYERNRDIIFLAALFILVAIVFALMVGSALPEVRDPAPPVIVVDDASNTDEAVPTSATCHALPGTTDQVERWHGRPCVDVRTGGRFASMEVGS